MSLVKTEKGRAALQNREAGLTQRQRQILLMSDGKRSRAEMLQMFTSDISADVHHLLGLNLLIDVSKKVLTADNLSATGTFRVSDLNSLAGFVQQSGHSDFGGSSAPPQSMPSGLGQSGDPAADSKLAALSPSSKVIKPKMRRSMAAAKMYVVDILQRMRDMDSPAFAVSIQTSTDEADLAESLINAVRYIYRKSGGTFGARVFEKLYETMPEAYLHDMDHLAAELAEVQ